MDRRSQYSYVCLSHQHHCSVVEAYSTCEVVCVVLCMRIDCGDVGAGCLTLKVLVTTIDAQWEGMGDVGSARYEPALLPPCPTVRVLSYSN